MLFLKEHEMLGVQYYDIYNRKYSHQKLDDMIFKEDQNVRSRTL